MAPKKDFVAAAKKRATGGQWDRRTEEYYNTQIKPLDRVTFEKVHEYMAQGLEPEAAHKQVLWDEYEGQPRVKGPEEAEDCPGCQRHFSNPLGRTKMASLKCEHILCTSCVEDLYMLGQGRCLEKGCGVMLGSDDWAKWEPPGEPVRFPLGFVPERDMPPGWGKGKKRAPTPVPEPEEEEEEEEEEAVRVKREESEGLFVTDDEDN